MNKNKFVLIDKIRKDFKNNINMSFAEYRDWIDSKRSKEVNVNKNVVRKTKHLLSLNNDQWNIKQIKLAIMLLNNLKRVRGGKNSVRKRISLRNHGVRVTL